MLYLVLGNNRQAQKEYINELKTKTCGDLIYLDKDTFTEQYFENAVFGVDIFGGQTHIVLDEVCETSELQEYIVGLASGISASTTIVILLQKDLLDASRDSLIDYVTESVEFKLDSARPDFSLWSAYYARDKKASWMTYVSQIETEAIEKIHGGLLSQTKNMYKTKISSPGDNYKTLGFSTEKSFNTASSAAKKFTLVELAAMYFGLVQMPLLAHNGEIDFKLELEKFILTHL